MDKHCKGTQNGFRQSDGPRFITFKIWESGKGRKEESGNSEYFNRRKQEWKVQRSGLVYPEEAQVTGCEWETSEMEKESEKESERGFV